MEEAPFLSLKTTKSEAKQQVNNHRNSSSRSGGPNNTLAAAQVAFRLLCHVHTAGGVIGNSGSIIKQLETLTGSKIRFEEPIPNCNERVVNIVGDAVLEKKISIGGGEEDGMVDVSGAQEGLMRVFERVLEVEGNAGDNENEDSNVRHNNGAIACRLLAPTGQIGAVMGKGGKIVDGIRKSSGAKIRVLKNEQTPLCAAPEEELIQIMGGVLAVKKALLAVSYRLQDKTLGEGALGHISAHGVPHHFHTDYSTKNIPIDSTVEHRSGHSLSADVERTLHIDENHSQKKVLFRFLCSNAIAGGVIGKGANVVKYLEKETGASIKFTSQVIGSKERVAIISSLENPDPLYSPAQIAIVRVFSRCIEVGLDQGMISSLRDGENVSARVLVASGQVSSMLDDNGRFASDISIASGAEIQLMGADSLPKFAGVDDNVVQISGDYENVKSALFQLAGRLREKFFSGTGHREAGCNRNSNSAIPTSSLQLAELSRLADIDKLDHLGFVQKSNSRGGPPRPVKSDQGLASFPCALKHERNVGNEGSKQNVEVVIAKEVFASVYGEMGSNLARLKEISGATIVLKDPFPGESSGKVIISGTPERIQIAQSLLHAFISF